MRFMFVIQEIMDGSNESEVGKSDPFLNIDWMYEFSAPKYFDFACEETDTEILAAERWFEIAIPYENSRTCSCFFNQLAYTVYFQFVIEMIFKLKISHENEGNYEIL
jgi:hypothetical protein